MPLVLLLLLAAAVIAACTSARLVEVPTEPIVELVHARQAEHLVRVVSAELPVFALAHVEQRSRVASLEEVLAEEGGGVALRPEVLERARAWYAARAHRPYFFYRGALTPSGELLLAALRSAHRVHVLYPEELELGPLLALLQEFDDAQDLGPLMAALQPSREEESRLLAWLLTQEGLDRTLPEGEVVVSDLLTLRGETPLPRLGEAMDTLQASMERIGRKGPQIELLFFDALLRYATVLRLDNPYEVHREVRRARRWSTDNAAHRAEMRAHLTDALIEALGQDPFVDVLASLEPPYPQVALLQQALERYRGFVAAGGWSTEPFPRTLRQGSEGRDVERLRARLAAEGFLPAEEAHGRTYTEVVAAAVSRYQATHQMRPTGIVNEEVSRSLQVSAERRTAQIALSLRRWRETRIGADLGETYIHVNLPDFHAELWHRGERLHRWRVIIGATRRGRGGELVTATPLFSRGLRHVVFNPYWNVPQSIRRRDYDHLIDQPGWLEENGFEIFLGEQGETWLRQLPGPTNALGYVKFLFPNEYNVYMHDTPTRNLFDRDLRAFSSGCIRVEEPMVLARWLLMLDRGWSEQRADDFIAEQLSREGEQWTTLRSAVPVHIEYFVVHAGPEGVAHFLADIYGHDRRVLDGVEERLFGSATAPVEDQRSIGPVDRGP